MNNTNAEDYIATNKLIYQSGVDFEAKPIVVFCAANLPDPNMVNYDELLDEIILKLDAFADNDYTCVVFAGGNRYKPSWTWLFRAYRRLGYKYKKNLKNLYIVHPSNWFQFLFDFMNKLISPKFYKKVSWIKTLSQLALSVPLSHMNIPNVVYEYNRRFEENVIMDPERPNDTIAKKFFSVPLEKVMGNNGEKGIPLVVRECMDYILNNGMDEEGVFRRSPSSVLLKEAKNAYDEERKVELNEYGVHVAAVLLKVYVRELPEPLIPSRLYDAIKEMEPHLNDVDALCDYISKQIISQLSTPSQQLLKFLCTGLNKLSLNSNKNLMTSNNLAIVWAPNLLRSGNLMLDASICSTAGPTAGNCLKVAIEFPDKVFKLTPEISIVSDREDKNPVPPPKPPRGNLI